MFVCFLPSLVPFCVNTTKAVHPWNSCKCDANVTKTSFPRRCRHRLIKDARLHSHLCSLCQSCNRQVVQRGRAAEASRDPRWPQNLPNSSSFWEVRKSPDNVALGTDDVRLPEAVKCVFLFRYGDNLGKSRTKQHKVAGFVFSAVIAVLLCVVVC